MDTAIVKAKSAPVASVKDSPVKPRSPPRYYIPKSKSKTELKLNIKIHSPNSSKV